jgi:hypothetical protein
MTTAKLSLSRESYNAWRRTVHRYCRVALNTDIGAGPGWTIPWTPHHDEHGRMVYPTWFTPSLDIALFDLILMSTDPQHEQRILLHNNPTTVCQRSSRFTVTPSPPFSFLSRLR